MTPSRCAAGFPTGTVCGHTAEKQPLERVLCKWDMEAKQDDLASALLDQIEREGSAQVELRRVHLSFFGNKGIGVLAGGKSP